MFWLSEISLRKTKVFCTSVCVCLFPVCVSSSPVNAILQLLLLLSAGSEISLPPPVVLEIFPGLCLLF